MLDIDKRILNIDQVICDNIELLGTKGVTRALVSQNLLAQSRNLVEHIAVKEYGNGTDIMADWQTIPKALEYIKGDNKFLFLRKFHSFLQESKSHYTPDADGAERLVLKYYEYYMMLREFAKKECGLEILHNIDKFPINMDKAVIGYYRAVLKILEKQYEFIDYSRNERLYVMRSKVVIVDNKICYENTLIPANDISSKFDRFIAFSTFMIPDHYAIRADIRSEQIIVENQKMPVHILVKYQVALRPCELNNFAKIFGYRISMNQSLVEYFGDIDDLIKTHNQKLYYKHHSRELCRFGKHYLYIREHYEDTKQIIEELIKLSKEGIAGYKNFANNWMDKNPEAVNCDEKRLILQEMFKSSKVYLIYGAAGTGKTYLLNHVAQLFDSSRKLFLANTNPAVDNLRRKMKAQNCEFSTIAKFLSKKTIETVYDMLIIDECSMVSNSDMRRVIEKVAYKLLVLVGDIYQIEAISFGNWFSFAKYFLQKKSWKELVTPFRAKNSELLELWKKVRNLDDNVTEYLVNYNYSSVLNESIFQQSSDDEIILCLNYNGLYGINNINRFLQNNNSSPEVRWGMWTYKVGDPVLFNESKRFAPILYNNLKGRITDIKIEENSERIWFSVEINKEISELNTSDLDLELLDTNSLGKSVVKFYVDKSHDSDEDYDTEMNEVVPFQIAYAVSIHKAQGLEYESVKVVITEDIDEMITHNIFYTAITRARRNLKIYWSLESQQRVISRFEKMDARNDATIFSGQSELKIMNKHV